MMRIVWLLLALTPYLFAASDTEKIVETYRHRGIAPIEEMLDRTLAKETYWRRQLRHHDVAYGYFDKPTDLLLCSKEKKILKLYAANGRFHLKHEAPIIVGKMPGDKQEEGDMRTPIGVYHIVERKESPGEEYGPLAFVTDYPNRFDKILGKNGHGIWLHGFPLGCDDKNATKGCIAVNNDNLLQLDGKLNYRKALLIISERPLQKVKEETMARLLAFLFGWRYDWKYNRLEPYLSHYDETLIFQSRYDYDYFRRYKRRVFEKNDGKKKVLRFTDLKIVPYPNSLGKKLWFVQFDEFYRSGGYRFEGKKELIVQEKGDGSFKIVVE